MRVFKKYLNGYRYVSFITAKYRFRVDPRWWIYINIDYKHKYYLLLTSSLHVENDVRFKTDYLWVYNWFFTRGK